MDLDSIFGDAKKIEIDPGKSFTDSKNDKPKKKSGFDLFKDKPEPKELDIDKIKIVNEVLYVEASPDMKLTDEQEEVVRKVMEILNDNKYKVRLYCNKASVMYRDIYDKLGSYNVTIIKPWRKYCPVNKGNIWLPTKDNIEVAANYIRDFDKRTTGIKYINSAWITALLGKDNTKAVKFVLLADPNYDGKKFDFKKSPDTSSVYFVIKDLKDISFNIFNLFNEDDLKSLVQLIKS